MRGPTTHIRSEPDLKKNNKKLRKNLLQNKLVSLFTTETSALAAVNLYSHRLGTRSHFGEGWGELPKPSAPSLRGWHQEQALPKHRMCLKRPFRGLSAQGLLYFDITDSFILLWASFSLNFSSIQCPIHSS